MANIILIKDMANSILEQRTQSPASFGQAYFEGPSKPVEPVKRMDVSVDIEIGKKQFEPMTTFGDEGDTTTSTPTPAPTPALAKVTTLSPYPIASGIVVVP